MEKLKKALKTGVCPFCKQKFEKTRKDKKYCSSNCRVDDCLRRKEKEKEEAIRAATIRELKNQNVSKNFQEAAAPPPPQKKEKKAIINNAAPPQEKDHQNQEYFNFEPQRQRRTVINPNPNAFENLARSSGGTNWLTYGRPQRNQKQKIINTAAAPQQPKKTFKLNFWGKTLWTCTGIAAVYGLYRLFKEK